MKRKVVSLILAVMMILSSVSVSAFALGTCKIKVETVDGMPGQTITVNVVVENNPGILGLSAMSITYDSSVLTLTNAENGSAFSALNFTRPSTYKSGCVFTWYAENISGSDIKDGVILTLTFTVASNASEGTYAIGVSCPPGNVYDKYLNELTPSFENGGVTVVNYTPGDVDGNGVINARDLIFIARYIADGCTTDPDGYNVTIIAEAANVNLDSRINAMDLILIARYIADGCTTDPLGYNVTLYPSPSLCSHSLEYVAAKAATCTVDGNNEYWHCTKCGKYFSNAGGTAEISLDSTVIAATGHHPVVDPAVPATTTSTGLTEGSHCDICGTTLVPQTIIPMLAATQYAINYHISNDDNYLSQLSIDNPNPSYYTSENGLTLRNLTVAGYVFEGWYDMEGSNGQLVRTIPAGTTGEIDLYAKWTVRQYTITFDSPLVPVASKTYSVNVGTTLSNPTLGNYIFMGWTDDDCNIVKSIAPGTTGNMTLHANWTSRRNLTKTVTDYGDPIIIEDSDEGIILFAYEIGTVENVPLSNLSEVYTAVSGMSQTYTTSGTTSISSTNAQTIASTISDATTSSGAWTLSSDWNSVSSVSEAYAAQQGWTQEEAETHAKTSTDTYCLNSSSGGSSTTMNSDGTSAKTSNSSSSSNTTSTEAGAEISTKVKVGGGPVSGEVGGKFNIKTKGSGTEGVKNGEESGATTGHSTTSSSTWNTTESHNNSNSVSSSQTISNSLSKAISESKNYGSSYAEGGSNSASQAFSNTQSASNQYSTAITYSCAETITRTQTFELGGESEGYYRVVLAGTAHVFGVVGYDVKSQSYFVYTYSVIDDNTYPWVDYSKTTAQFNDYPNGVLPFEVSYDIKEFVDSRLVRTEGLIISDEGIVTGYTGTDNVVIIPSYYRLDNLDGTYSSVKVVGIAEGAFKNNTDLYGIYLSYFMTEIDDSAFEGCTNLRVAVCPGIESIGENAFKGCTLLREFKIPTAVTSLGNNAFEGIEKITVEAINQNVANGAINSGASQVVLNISADPDAMAGAQFTVPSSVEYFELRGNAQTYSNIELVSDAQETVLNGMTITSTTGIPLKLSSENITFNRFTVNSNGYALLLSNDADISLYGTNNLNSNSGNAVVCRNLNLSKIDPAISSVLNVSGNLLICGSITGQELLNVNNGQIIYLSEDDFANYIRGSYDIALNANGGAVSDNSITVFYGKAYGELPTPTRDYYTFTGWYTQAEGGNAVIAETVYNDVSVTTLFAHWTLNPTSGWVLASEMPEGAQVVSQKWTYDQTSYTESGSSSLDGWTLYDTQRTSWGTTQGPVNSDPSGNGRNVWSEQYVSSNTHHYKYYHMSSGSGTWGSRSSAPGWTEHNIDLTDALTFRANGSYGIQWYGSYACPQCGATGMWICDGEYDVPNYSTRWYYQEPVYTYYFTKTDSLESATEVTASDTISNVQAWVQYRAK